MNEFKCPVPREQQPTNEFLELSRLLLSLSKVPESDAADALAVAICHSNLNLSSSNLDR